MNISLNPGSEIVLNDISYQVDEKLSQNLEAPVFKISNSQNKSFVLKLLPFYYYDDVLKEFKLLKELHTTKPKLGIQKLHHSLCEPSLITPNEEGISKEEKYIGYIGKLYEDCLGRIDPEIQITFSKKHQYQIYNSIGKIRLLTLDEKLRAAFHLTSGLFSLHQQGIIYGDIKPENVLYNNDENGNLKRTVFCDFIGSQIIHGNASPQKAPIFTYDYTCPRDLFDLGKDSDIFSFGMLLYIIFSNGKFPFLYSESGSPTDTYQELDDDDIPEEINELIRKMLDFNRTSRPKILEVYQIIYNYVINNNFDLVKDIFQNDHYKIPIPQVPRL